MKRSTRWPHCTRCEERSPQTGNRLIPMLKSELKKRIVRIQEVLRSARSQLMWSMEQEIKAA